MRNILSTLKIGFDVDGILADTDAYALSWLQERGHVGKEKTPADITHWSYKDSFGVPDEAAIAMFTDPEFFATVPPIPEAIDLLYRLHRAGAEIHILTDCACPKERTLWLQQNGVLWDRLEIIKGDKKHLYSERFGLDYFLEDNPQTAAHLASTPMSGLSFLRDRPYNRNATFMSKLCRFYVWDELFKFFRIN